jgi:hypothetical protein
MRSAASRRDCWAHSFVDLLERPSGRRVSRGLLGLDAPASTFDPRRVHKNFAKLGCGRRGQAGGRVDEVDGVDFVAQARFAPYPSGDERSDDEMRLYSVPFVDNRLHMPVEGDDLRFDADLFHKLPGERGGERLADLNDAAGQAEMAEQRRPRAADDKRPAAPKHRRRDREDRACGE